MTTLRGLFLVWALGLAGCDGALQSVGGKVASSDGGEVASSDGGATGTPEVAVQFVTELEPDGLGCLPQALPTGADGKVSCILLVAPPGDGPACVADGLSQASADTLAEFNAATFDAGAGVCELVQLPSLTTSDGDACAASSPGWCYVKGANPSSSEQCAQAIRFAPDSIPAGARLWLGCS